MFECAPHADLVIMRRDSSGKTEREWITASACLNRQRFVNHARDMLPCNRRLIACLLLGA